MDLLKKLVLLSTLLALASCNETISPELQQGGVITPPGGGTVVPPVDEHYFRLTNGSENKLKYLLHKTGAGGKEAKCEVTSQQPFSPSTFKPNNDITCFLEAEELALYQDGFKLDLETSTQACKYVVYSPFSYYNRMPGDSSGNYEIERCDPSYTGLGPGPAPAIGCDRAISTTLVGGVSFPAPDQDEKLCRFNHNDKEKCDVGVINIIEKTYSTVDDGSGGTIDIATSSPTRQIRCGGKAVACAQGPYASESNNGADFHTSAGKIYGTPEDEPFKAQVSYPSLNDTKRAGTFVYANFRRNLANYTIAYGEDDDSIPYKQSFIGISDFHPMLLTEYSLIGETFLAFAGVTVPNSESNQYSAKPFAAEPFMGLRASIPYSNNTVNPFYTFECMDNADEVKARIRVMVRDWDRVRSEDATLASDVELISDIARIPEGSSVDRDLGGSYRAWSRQDIDAPEPDADIPSLSNFNDFLDWDDIIKMRYLSPGIGSRGYMPVEGYFSVDNFPNENFEDH